MNAITPMADQPVAKHYALALDKDGNEVKIEIPFEAEGYVQDSDEAFNVAEPVTVH